LNEVDGYVGKTKYTQLCTKLFTLLDNAQELNFEALC